MGTPSTIGKHALFILGSLSAGIFSVFVYPSFILIERSINKDITQNKFPKAPAILMGLVALILLAVAIL